MGGDLDQSIKTTAVAVDDSEAVVLPAVSQTDRQGFLLQNLGADPIWIGGADVTPENGIKVDVDQTFSDPGFGPMVKVYAICDSSETADVRVMELS